MTDAFPMLRRKRAVTDRALKFIDFEPRRRRARTLAGGTRAFFSAYHRKNESSESRTLKRVRGLLAPGWGAGVFSFLIPGVALAAARLTPANLLTRLRRALNRYKFSASYFVLTPSMRRL